MKYKEKYAVHKERNSTSPHTNHKSMFVRDGDRSIFESAWLQGTLTKLWRSY